MKELEDYDWFPKRLRQYQISFIGFIAIALDLYKPLKNILTINKQFIKWIDLCSGNGMPAAYLKKGIKSGIPLALTDKFPIDNQITYFDALESNYTLNTFYTMFNSLHHFTTTEQLTIIEKIKKNKGSFLFVEILQPNIFYTIKIFFAATIGQLLFAPFVKPFSFTRLLFTYIIPINIITVLYDGIVSVGKAIPAKQLKKIAAENSTATYKMESLTLQTTYFNKIYILKGNPIDE